MVCKYFLPFSRMPFTVFLLLSLLCRSFRFNVGPLVYVCFGCSWFGLIGRLLFKLISWTFPFCGVFFVYLFLRENAISSPMFGLFLSILSWFFCDVILVYTCLVCITVSFLPLPLFKLTMDVNHRRYKQCFNEHGYAGYLFCPSTVSWKIYLSLICILGTSVKSLDSILKYLVEVHLLLAFVLSSIVRVCALV